MSSLIAAVLNSLWQAAAMSLCVWAALRSARRMNAATRHAVWWAVLVAVIVLPAGPSLLEKARSRGKTSATISAIVADIGKSAPAPTTIHAPAPLRRPSPAPVELRTGAWIAIIPAVWLALVLLQLARLAWSFRYVGRLKRRAVPAPAALQRSFDGWMKACRVDRPARLLVSGETVSPMAVGFRKPAVILPESLLANFGEDELDHVLLHELAHLARRDDWTNLAARLAAAAVGLHPVAGWILRRIEREREIACDDWVVSMTGAPRPYAQSLTRLFELCWRRKRVLLASGMAGRPSQLGERIEELLRRREFAPHASVVKVFMSVLALLAFALAAAGIPRWIVFARHAEPAPRQAAEWDAGRRPRPVKIAQVSRPKRALAPASQTVTTAPPAGGFLAALVAAGYGDLPVDEIIALKNSGITPGFIVEMSQTKWGKLPPQDLINFRNHGVSPSYAEEMLNSGIKGLTVNDVIQLRQHNVDPGFVREAHSLGFGPFSPREIMDLRNHGVGVPVLQALKDGGFVRATPGEIIGAQQAGVRENHFREAKQFSSSLTLQQVIKLKNAGVLR